MSGAEKAALRMPAEWEEQDAVWLAWPHNESDWPGKFGPIPWAYAEIVRAIAAFERVRLLVKTKEMERDVRSICKRAGVNLALVDFYVIPTDRGWLRDCGPIFVFEGKQKKMLDWVFNGWAKYTNHKLDNAVPQRIHSVHQTPRIMPKAGVRFGHRHVVLEGGAIDVNGKGAALTTEECLLSRAQERNPGFKREDYEAIFAHYLGATHTIWLGKGIAGDDTHGHVDDIARFVNPTTVAAVSERRVKDDNHQALKDNLKRLKAARDQRGKPLTVIELPMPRPVCFEGERLPASYANFLITNHAVLVPTFNDPADRDALSILGELFPKREIIGIHALDLVWGLGTIHCLSQQEPLC